MIQSLISGLVPFQINNSTVNINNSTEQNKENSVPIKYIISNNNSNIIVNNCNLNEPEFIAYAYNNSNIYIDEKTLASSKRQSNRFIADDNSFINYNFPAAYDESKNNYIQPLYNNGEAYTYYDNSDANIKNNKNRLIYKFQVNESGEKLPIKINTTIKTTLQDAINDLQSQIDSIPSVLNGYTLEINLTNLSNISNIDLTKPLIINKFYQGTVKIIGNYSAAIKYRIPYDKDIQNKISESDFINYLNLDPSTEKFSKFALPFLLVSEVDDCIIEDLRLEFEDDNSIAVKNDRIYSMIFLNEINNLQITKINLNMRLLPKVYNSFNLFEFYNLGEFSRINSTICKR